MSEWMPALKELLTVETISLWARSLTLLVVGLIVARLVSGSLARMLAARLEKQQVRLMQRLAFYLILGVFLTAALNQLGFNLGVILGAASVATVAIGFAAQTSTANIISGLFLIAERPFSIGDVIQVGGTTGVVLSIDWLSVKLRTFDNLYVRIPNETLIKTEIRTLTRFPIRRFDFRFLVAYEEDLKRVRELLLDVAAENSLVLEEPRALIIMDGFEESGVRIQFSVWAKAENFLDVKNSVLEEVKHTFREHEIDVPIRPVTLHWASPSEIASELPGGQSGPDRTPA